MCNSTFKNIIFILCLIVCIDANAQIRLNNNHKIHKIVTDKQYELKADSANYAAEFFYGNTNTWTGDNYGFQPSFQFLLTYDNNKNLEFGAFGCMNYHGFNGGFSNGIDFFIVTKLSKKLSLITDVYTFLNRKDSLVSFFGYQSNIYNNYSVKLKYDFNPRIDLILGYSALNNKHSLEQGVSIEFDYNIADALTFIIQYNTGTDFFNVNEANFASAIGFATFVKKFRLGLTFNPLFQDTAPSYFSPFLFVLSRDLSIERHRNKKVEIR